MSTILWKATLIMVFVAVASSAAVWSQESSSADTRTPVTELPGSALGDSSRTFAPELDRGSTDGSFRANTERPLSMYLAKNTRLLFGYETYRVSTLECALDGVGMGMTLGMCAGALGMMGGVWDEQTSWYIVGAAAALGAILGTTKVDDPNWSVRIRWDPDR